MNDLVNYRCISRDNRLCAHVSFLW
jgi:hypothetical protein